MADTVEIYNLALLHLGAKPCTAIDDGSAGANAITRAWATAVKAILSAANWDFALKQAELVQGSTPLFGYDYSYTLPSDFLKALKLSGNADGFQWEIKDGVLCIDLDSADGDGYEVELEYVAYITDVTLFPAFFVEALSYKLAIMVAPALLGQSDGLNAKRALEEFYQLALQNAAFVTAQNQNVNVPGTTAADDDSFLSARDV